MLIIAEGSSVMTNNAEETFKDSIQFIIQEIKAIKCNFICNFSSPVKLKIINEKLFERILLEHKRRGNADSVKYIYY